MLEPHGLNVQMQLIGQYLRVTIVPRLIVSTPIWSAATCRSEPRHGHGDDDPHAEGCGRRYATDRVDNARAQRSARSRGCSVKICWYPAKRRQVAALTN